MEDDVWLELSARLQRVMARRAGRTDLVLRIAPLKTIEEPETTDTTEVAAVTGAWSGVFYPDLAEIRLDSRAVLEAGRDDPRFVDLSRAADRGRYARLAGVVSLAVAHARHSTWALPTELATTVALAAQALEAGRVLNSHVTETPGDREWVRFAVPSVVTRPGLWGQVQSMCVVQAALLTPHELAVARAGLSERAGDEAANRALAVIAAASALGDGDRDGLLCAASELVSILGQARDRQGRSAGSGSGDGEAAPTRLREEIIAQAREAESAQRRPTLARVGTVNEARAAERAQAAFAAVAARDVFERPRETPGILVRQPTHELQLEERLLASELRRARFRAEDLTRLRRGQPPGRLRMPEAMRREAQLAARAEVTARPWLELRRRVVEFPRLTVGLSWDISRSRSHIHLAMADFAWVLARAARDIDASMAAIAWNTALTPVVWPDRAPDAVREPACSGGSTGCPQSLRALDGALGLTRESGARVVVIATDGRIGNRRSVQAEISGLVAAGVTVLWLTAEPDPRAPRGATAVVVPSADRLIRALGRAVSRQLSMIDA